MDGRGNEEWLRPTDAPPVLARGERHLVLARLRRLTGYGTGFPQPTELAAGISLDLYPVPRLPGGCTTLTDGRHVLYLADPCRRVSGTRIFLGVAGALLGLQELPHTRADVWFLAGRLAAPPLLVREIGIDEAVRRQTWATELFLRRWWRERQMNVNST